MKDFRKLQVEMLENMKKIRSFSNFNFTLSKAEVYETKTLNIDGMKSLEMINSDCLDIKNKKNGFYDIKPHFSKGKLRIYCDFYLKDSIGIYLNNFSDMHLNLREPRIFKDPKYFLR